MPLPNFTNDELYLINYIKSLKSSDNFNSHMWGNLIGGGLIAGFALCHDSIMMMLAAFVFICGSRLYEESFYRKQRPVWKTIIEKYEESAMKTPNDKSA